jgi:hypothetical protein
MAIAPLIAIFMAPDGRGVSCDYATITILIGPALCHHLP